MSDVPVLSALTAMQWSRRRVLRTAALLPALSLVGCGKPLEPRLRIGTNIWPGFEFIYAARDRGLFDGTSIKLVELLSATDVLQALAADALEGGTLTLDEVLTARAGGIDLRVVAISDISAGADALLARPGIETLADLRGCRIALEQTAVGAVVLAAALRRAGLEPAEVRLIHSTVDRHVEIFSSGDVDAVVTFDPARAQLLAAGAVSLFDSRQIAGQIVDVFAMRPQALESRPHAVRTLIAGHFAMQAQFARTPQQMAPQLASRLGLSAADTLAVYKGLNLPGLAENRRLLEGRPAPLEETAAELGRIMLQANLLPAPAPLEELIDSRWLPTEVM